MNRRHFLLAASTVAFAAPAADANEFEVKPQGACRADLCIPISRDLRQGGWFHLTGFARKIRQAIVADAGVWSFGEIPPVSQASEC